MKTVEIKGKKYPYEITLGALIRFSKETGKDIAEISGVADLITLMWCCVVSVAKRDDTGFDLGLEEFSDNLGVEVVSEFSETFSAFSDKGAKGSKKKD